MSTALSPRPASPLAGWMGLQAIARAIGKSYPHTWALAAGGAFGDSTPVGRTLLFSRDAVDQYIASQAPVR